MAALMFVLFVDFVAGVGGGSFVCTALHKFVVFDARARSVLTHPWIRVNVDMAICPVALPANAVDEDGVTGPNNARSAPTPGVEPGADGYAEADGRANHKAGPRGREHDQQIVDRDHDERRIRFIELLGRIFLLSPSMNLRLVSSFDCGCCLLSCESVCLHHCRQGHAQCG